ncbi:hypothetical protein EJB05_44169 [Eragrostis curvula]|uniref:Poly(A) RNA polymerase mitochondrial-like central palm domain-containing protein n=1 Tax=Eragrostis curvula TaxID=38414 RepID=A0A5J9TH36_9POAL|nr:hypothetical protein EJB05_44169 [Eragrostis curvula]
MAAAPSTAAHASSAASFSVSSSISDDDDDDSSQSSDVSVWDSQELRRHAECLELEELTAISVDSVLLPTLNDMLMEVYTLLRPKPLDYEQRNALVHVFSKMTTKIFGNNNGFPVVEAFGSFTMDLFTPRSDLDLSINFSDNNDDRYTRKKKISAIRKFAKVLYSHQRDGICCGVLPIVSARVPILKVIDRGTGIECDISVENKDGMTRSMIFKLISSLDERFQILSYLAKFWAKVQDLNSPRELTMSSMSIISLVAFHLQLDVNLNATSCFIPETGFCSVYHYVQTRDPPILPPFSALLNDGLDCASFERHIRLFKDFGSRNKESVAQLFVSLMSKVEDFLDRSQNFARSVGKMQMKKICKCLRDCLLNLLDFMRGKINTSKLKTLLFGHLSPDELASKPRLRHAKRKRKLKLSPESRYLVQKRAKHSAHHVEPHSHANARTATGLQTPAAKVMPHIQYQRSTQSSAQIVRIPWPRIIPSGFGYGLSVQLPVDPHCGKGILGPPPDMISLSNGIQRPQQRPLLPTPRNVRLA